MRSIVEAHAPVIRPIRTVQFGEGNFLRAFVGDLWQSANDHGIPLGNIAVVKPRVSPETYDPLAKFRAQNGVYTVLRRGRMDGTVVDEAKIIDCVAEFLYPDRDRARVRELFRSPELFYVVSNTTEAGIALSAEDSIDTLAKSYPAKLTQLLYDRFTTFSGDPARGLTILPMELIEHNGTTLRECVLEMACYWELPAGFAAWIRKSCVFVNTLVDRIVTGKPHDHDMELIWHTLGYRDEAVAVCEPFFSLVLEDKAGVAVLKPLRDAGLSVTVTDDLTRYRERKVRILNGAHTGNVLCGILAGIPIVRDLVEHPDFGAFFADMLRYEILPYVPVDPADPDGVRRFADSVRDRFDNPYIDHRLLDISIESAEKWRVRILPSLHDAYRATGKLPLRLTFSFAALLAFLTGVETDGAVMGTRADGSTYPIRDTHAAEFLAICHLPAAEYVRRAVGMRELWGCDLAAYPCFVETVSEMLTDIRKDPVEAVRKWSVRS